MQQLIQSQELQLPQQVLDGQQQKQPQAFHQQSLTQPNQEAAQQAFQLKLEVDTNDFTTHKLNAQIEQNISKIAEQDKRPLAKQSTAGTAAVARSTTVNTAIGQQIDSGGFLIGKNEAHTNNSFLE